MNQDALGLIEVVGLTAAIEAADTCVKASNVKLLGCEKVTGGLVTIKIQGDVGAVTSAVEAGKMNAERVGTIVATFVIPSPRPDISPMIVEKGYKNNEIKQITTDIKAETLEENLEVDEKIISSVDEKVKLVNQNQDKFGNNNKIPDSKENNKTEEKFTEGIAIENGYPEVQGNHEKNDVNQTDQQEINNTEKKVTCNICNDPECPREKGQPRNLCIHYHKGEIS